MYSSKVFKILSLTFKIILILLKWDYYGNIEVFFQFIGVLHGNIEVFFHKKNA